MIRRPPRSTLFPYTRSSDLHGSGSCSPISTGSECRCTSCRSCASSSRRSEEHTSELQSLAYLVCRLLLEKKKKTYMITITSNNNKSLPIPNYCLTNHLGTIQ